VQKCPTVALMLHSPHGCLEHLFMCSFVIHLSYLTCLFKYFAQLCIYIFLSSDSNNPFSILYKNYWLYFIICNIFIHCWLFFSFFSQYLPKSLCFLIFMKSSQFDLLWLFFVVFKRKNILTNSCHRLFPPISVCLKHIGKSCFLMQCNNLYLLIEVFRPLIFNGAIGMDSFKSYILLFLLYLSHLFVFVLFIFVFFWINWIILFSLNLNFIFYCNIVVLGVHCHIKKILEIYHS
jgi:hypothetical protein